MSSCSVTRYPTATPGHEVGLPLSHRAAELADGRPPRCLMTARPAATGARAREMNLYRRYLDLVAADGKTIEVRVQYPNLRKLAAGDCIRFVCDRDDASPASNP
jgi:hypothetical protein